MTALVSRKTISEAAPLPPGLLPGPAKIFLKTFDGLHFFFGLSTQRLDLGVDLLTRAGGAPAGT
jgi:hypothetical protein